MNFPPDLDCARQGNFNYVGMQRDAAVATVIIHALIGTLRALVHVHA